MDIFEQILKKAEHEGQMDPRLAEALSGKKTIYWNVKRLQLPPIMTTLPENVIYALQKIMENIRQVSESKSVQIIGFTSAIPNQGTSTMISLLSLLMAAREKMSYEQVQEKNKNSQENFQLKHGVLLIDCQIHNPSLHHKFGLQQIGGILEVLENELQSAKLVKSIESSSLKVVTTGVCKDFQLNPNHLEKFKSLLDNAKKRVRFIFIDLPPVLAYSESISLSRLCDGIVLVMREDNRWEVLQEAHRHIEQADIPILSGVVNRKEYVIPSWVRNNI